ncbi:MAG: DUF2752 domain-containing protein [Phycisphaerales bacterium]|nr:DUF2752 domain-containing protein [Planctomycetota bacterium]MBL6997372.1 DUF2752 domain-containing protein [Phycisphaerales bacterium]
MQDQKDNIGICIPQKSERKRRIYALGVALATLFLLSIAFFLQPSTDGVGTHQQLGLPQCGWILAANVPCPTCGMTTAWSHTVRGELPSAFMVQPLGMLLAITAFLVVIGGFVTACTGYSFQPLLYRFPPSRIFVFLITAALVAWGFKILLHRGVL